MTRGIAWLQLLLVVAGGSCGGSHGGGQPVVPDGTEPIESFEADRIAAGCAVLFRCHDVATVEGCIKGTLGLVSPQIVADVQAGITKYDPHLGYHCVQVTLALPCLGSWDLSSCEDAFTGTLPAASACTLGTECASGTCSATNCGADCCPGTCADGVAVRSGCATASGVCPVNEDCTSTGACAARVGVGGKCGNGLDCQAGLICDSSLGPACRPPAALGEPCATTFCETSQSFCDSMTRICRNPPAIGDPCTGVLECGLALDCVNGACAVPGVVGEPCVGASGSVQCQQGYSAHGGVDCINGLCANTDFASRGLACAPP